MLLLCGLVLSRCNILKGMQCLQCQHNKHMLVINLYFASLNLPWLILMFDLASLDKEATIFNQQVG